MSLITTIGYEGASPEDLVATLQATRVSVVLDIRDVPISRRRGFSKKALTEALEQHGVRYVHLKGLGDPKEGREAARQGRHADFVRIFSAHMATERAKADLAEAARIVGKNKVCLLCYERDPAGCHRTVVANALSAIVSVGIDHLGVREGLAKHGGAGRAQAWR